MQDDVDAVPGAACVDRNEARRFLDLLDPRGVFTFQTFSDRKDLKRTFYGRDGKPRQSCVFRTNVTADSDRT